LVDATTLSLLATIVQTTVITLTLLVFIFQFRSQERAVKQAAYQNVLGRVNNLMMSPENTDDRLLARLIYPGGEIDPSEATTIRRLLISYGIIEEAYELYKKGWIDGEAWEQWNTWLKAMSRNPHFAQIHNYAAGMYDKDFQEHVSKMLSSKSDPAK
jgi:hypothetical protein